MIIVGIKDGVVDICISVDDLQTLSEMYPEHLLLERAGEEDIGWTFDGITFTAPLG